MSSNRRRTYSSFNSMGMLSSGKYVVAYSNGISGLPSPYNNNYHYVVYNLEEESVVTRFTKDEITTTLNLSVTNGIEYNGSLYLGTDDPCISTTVTDFSIGDNIRDITNPDNEYYMGVIISDDGVMTPTYGILDPYTGDKLTVLVYRITGTTTTIYTSVVLDDNDCITKILCEMQDTVLSSSWNRIGLYNGCLYSIGNGKLNKTDLVNGTQESLTDIDPYRAYEWFIT